MIDLKIIKSKGAVLVAIIILSAIYILKNSSAYLRTIAALTFLIFFYFFDNYFKINFQKKHYFIAFFISFFGIFLSPVYYIYPNYDKILHFIQPIMAGSIFFFMINKLKIDHKIKIYFTFAAIITVVGIHEIAEYLLDVLFDLKLQGVYLRDISGIDKLRLITNRIDDTMIDMSFGLLGALLYSAYLFLTHKSKNHKRSWLF